MEKGKRDRAMATIKITVLFTQTESRILPLL